MELASKVDAEKTSAGLVQAALDHALSAGMARTGLRGFPTKLAGDPNAINLSKHCVKV